MLLELKLLNASITEDRGVQGKLIQKYQPKWLGDILQEIQIDLDSYLLGMTKFIYLCMKKH